MEIPDRLGRALGDRYRIDRLVGEGGMALVYLAEDVKHGRRVAVKVLRPEISTSLATERFLREIEVAAGLNHPNVLALHDSGETDGLLYFVMPYVEGESLRDRLRRDGCLSTQEAIRITEEIADALDYAHARKLVHRDIKPENILFQAGHALVGDFGIAQLASRTDDHLTRTGVSLGTLPYMSPEQLDDTRTVDHRTDVYALGCVLHEMLTGEHPFAGGSLQSMMARKLTGEIPDLTEQRPDLPPTVHRTVARALSVDPAFRYDSAGALATAVSRAMADEAVGLATRARHPRDHLRRAAGAFLVTALGVAGWMASRSGPDPSMDRIVVLPLENGQGDPDQQFFVEGAYTDFLHELSNVVPVISPPSARWFSERGMTADQIAEELNVDGVITGRASLGSGLVTLTLRLADASGLIVWTDRFESPAEGILDLYRKIALAVADQMGVPLDDATRARLASSQEVDPEVYQALLQARFNWQKLTPEGIDTAEDYYGRVVSLDSLNAEGWWGLTQVWNLRAQMGLVSGEEALERGAPYRMRAEQLDPALMARQGGIRAWIDWDFEGAERAYRLDVARDPTDAVTRAYFAHLLLYRGKQDEAEEMMTYAVESDPYNTRVQSLYGQYLNFTRRYDEAEAAFMRVLRREPDDPLALSNARTTYHHLGRYDEAIPIWREYYGSAGDTAAVRALDEGYARGGYRAGLRAVAEEFATRDDDAKLWQIATLYTRAGDDQSALDYLEQAMRVRDPNTPYITIDPLFDHLRNEPRFRAIIDSLYAPRD